MLLTLATFHTKPSWLNRAGRIDRGACAELKASDLWRRVPQRDWIKRSLRDPGYYSGTPRLLADGRADVTLYDLSYLHGGRRPHAHKGDYRTQKSNVFKPADENKFRRGPWLTPAGVRRAIDPARTARGFGVANPNKGTSCSKTLGLPADWSQQLTVQRWRIHPHLAQHFFACPHCKQRALKLFLPLCYHEELRDAGFARLWLDSHEKCINRSPTLRPQASKLIQRYGPLFTPRRMLCRKCLRLRYGDVRNPPRK